MFTDIRPALREAFVVGFACFLVVLVGVATYQYYENVGSVIVLCGLLGGLGYLFYVWQL